MRQGLVGIERMLAFVLRAAGSDWEVFSSDMERFTFKGSCGC